MNGKTHVAIGTLAAAMLAPKLGVDLDFPLMIGATLGSLILDLDHPSATLNQKILPLKNKYTHLLIYSVIGFFIFTSGLGTANTFLKVAGIFLILIGLSKHRELTHSILGLITITYLCHQMNTRYGYKGFSVGIVIGATVHLLADLITGAGVALLYPFTRKRIVFPVSIKTNGLVENLIFVTTSFLLLIVIMSYI